MADIELVNLKEVIDRIERLPDGAKTIVTHAFDKGLQGVREHAKNNHPEWPTKLFNPDGTWRYHDITTNLSNSINMIVYPWKGEVLEGDVGVKKEWAKVGVMQYGGKIERDHPYLAPAVEAKKGEWINLIEKALRSFFQ